MRGLLIKLPKVPEVRNKKKIILKNELKSILKSHQKTPNLLESPKNLLGKAKG